MSLRARNWILVLDTGSTSANGTFRTCRGGRTMSAIGGGTDLADTTADFPKMTHKRHSGDDVEDGSGDPFDLPHCAGPVADIRILNLRVLP